MSRVSALTGNAYARPFSFVLKPTCSEIFLFYPGNMETKKCSVLVLDRPCGLELFRVNIEEPTSEGPSLELWECAMGHRTYYVSKEEDSISRAEN
jgi:hypothetical protein